MGNCLAKQDNEFPDFSGEKDAGKRQKIHKKRWTLLKKQGRRVRQLFDRCCGKTGKNASKETGSESRMPDVPAPASKVKDQPVTGETGEVAVEEVEVEGGVKEDGAEGGTAEEAVSEVDQPTDTALTTTYTQFHLDVINLALFTLSILQSANAIFLIIMSLHSTQKSCHLALTTTTKNNADSHTFHLPSLEKLNRLSPQTRVFKFRSLERRVEDRLAKLGLRMVKIPDDGNCFFRATSYALSTGKPPVKISHQQLRTLIVQYIVQNLHEFHTFMTSEDGDPITQLEDLLLDGSWCNPMADALPLALSRLTSRHVLIVSSHAENPTTILESTTEPTGTPIVLAYIARRGAEHYNATETIT
ncbi:uncharacterized protein LOC144918020 [Branchiostoma floridae x Branchiostoma belcheri]